MPAGMPASAPPRAPRPVEPAAQPTSAPTPTPSAVAEASKAPAPAGSKPGRDAGSIYGKHPERRSSDRRPEMPVAVSAERNEAGAERGGRERRRPHVQVEHRLALGEAPLEKAIVEVRAVGDIDRLPVLEAPDDDEGRVQ